MAHDENDLPRAKRNPRKPFCLECGFVENSIQELQAHTLAAHTSESTDDWPDGEDDRPNEPGVALVEPGTGVPDRKPFDLATNVERWKRQPVSGLTAKQEQLRVEIKEEAVARLHREAEELWQPGAVEAFDKALTARAEIILTEMYYNMLDASDSEHVETT